MHIVRTRGKHSRIKKKQKKSENNPQTALTTRRQSLIIPVIKRVFSDEREKHPSPRFFAPSSLPAEEIIYTTLDPVIRFNAREFSTDFPQ